MAITVQIVGYRTRRGLAASPDGGHGTSANRAQPRLTPAYQRKVFDDHQWRTVHVLCDLIIPADERSGSATQAGVPEFIDDWLDFRKQRGWQRRLGRSDPGRAGMAGPGIDPAVRQAISLTRHRRQQKQMLDRIAWPRRRPRPKTPWVAFFNKFRDLTVSGFFSSKMGVADCRISAITRSRNGRVRPGGVGHDRRTDEERL